MTTAVGMDEVHVRPIQLTDAKAAAELCTQLGYPTEAECMRERIGHLGGLKERVVYVACMAQVEIVAWIEVSIVHHLASGSYGQIDGLIVAEGCRGHGIGQKLVEQAERWLTAQGITNLIVRSRVTREAAHRFYLRQGYQLTKTSAVFSKQLRA